MKIFCIGRNYGAHALELKNEIPTEPVVFMKPANALLTDNKPFYYPNITKDLHYECEIVLRICKNGKAIEKKFASKYYDAITVGIDFTARDLQEQQKKKGLPWEIAKAFDQSAVIGKWVPISEEEKKNNIQFSLLKNNEMVQNGNTNDVIFNFDKIISYVSQYFSLNMGDVIYTGTPEGVGPVSIGDKLLAKIGEEELLHFEIK
jgi:2-keto-4-pentenoate hydratase/2-oxohepta-3-ene-1,7-dioic acid hydratase in catechol pathway